MTYLKLQNSYYFVFPIIAWIIIMMRHRSDAWRWIATNKGKLGQLKDLHHTTGRPVLASHLLLSSPSYTSGKSFPFSNSAHTSRLFYTTSAYSFSSSHSSYSNNGEESLTVLDSKRHEEVDPELRMRFSKIKLAMSKCINAEDFVGAKALYDEVIDNIHLGKNVNTVLMFLSMCDKAEHLPAVLSAVESMKKHNIPIIEQCYVSLIRCYADANMVDEVWKVLDLMKTQHIEARLRTLQPVLDSYSKHGDLAGALKVLHYIQDLQLEARPEQITSLLNAYAKARNKFQSHSSTEDVESFKKMKKQVDEILSHASQALFGVSLDDLEQISTTMNNMTVKEVRDIGVLVESIEDIGGPIISDADLVVDGSVVALNATYDNSFTIIDPRTPTPSHRNPYLPLGLKADAIHFIPQKFSVWSEKKKLFIAALKKQSEHVDDPSVGWVKTAKMLDEGQVQTVTKLAEVPEQEVKDKHNLFVGVPDLNWERSLPSRLVHVSSNTCRCPHCGGDILNVQISEKEKKEVCEALLRTAEEHSANQTHHLEVRIFLFL